MRLRTPWRYLRWRYLLLLLLLGGGVLAFALWRLSRDDERLTRWLTDSVQSASGLQMHTKGAGRFGFWPRLSIAIDGVELVSAQDGATPVRIASMRVLVPWASVFGRRLRVSAIDIEGVVLDAAAIDAWLAHRRDLGPLPAMRWPQLEAQLNLHDVRYRTVGADARPVDGILLMDLRLDRWQVDQAATLNASFSLPTLGSQPFSVTMQCTPRQTRTSIAIEPCTATIAHAGSPDLVLRGYFRHDDVARVESQLRIEAERLPDWIDAAPLQVDDLPVDIALRLVGALAGPLKAKLGGAIAGSTIEADVVLPYGWTQHVQQQDWMALAEQTTGHAHVDRLRGADAELENIEWRNEAPATISISPMPAHPMPAYPMSINSISINAGATTQHTALPDP